MLIIARTVSRIIILFSKAVNMVVEMLYNIHAVAEWLAFQFLDL